MKKTAFEAFMREPDKKKQEPSIYHKDVSSTSKGRPFVKNFALSGDGMVGNPNTGYQRAVGLYIPANIDKYVIEKVWCNVSRMRGRLAGVDYFIPVAQYAFDCKLIVYGAFDEEGLITSDPIGFTAEKEFVIPDSGAELDVVVRRGTVGGYQLLFAVNASINNGTAYTNMLFDWTFHLKGRVL